MRLRSGVERVDVLAGCCADNGLIPGVMAVDMMGTWRRNSDWRRIVWRVWGKMAW